jgi:hypothetical protein
MKSGIPDYGLTHAIFPKTEKETVGGIYRVIFMSLERVP